MKKITFILLGLISGTAIAQNSSFDTAEVFAEIVSPIAIERISDLNFGKIAVGAVGGTVTIPADATFKASYTETTMEIPSNTVAPARFSINAPVGTSYSLTIPDSNLSSSSNIMTIQFTHNREEDGNIGKGVDTQLIVGGILDVAANQPAGEYSGEVSVTVTYE